MGNAIGDMLTFAALVDGVTGEIKNPMTREQMIDEAVIRKKWCWPPPIDRLNRDPMAIATWMPRYGQLTADFIRAEFRRIAEREGYRVTP